MKTLIIILLSACHGWSKRDTCLELSSAAFNMVDALETRGIMADDVETNPFMGTHGQRIPLGVYVPVTMLLHVAVSAILPKGKFRTAWQIASVAVETPIIVRNWHLGYTPWNSDGLK